MERRTFDDEELRELAEQIAEKVDSVARRQEAEGRVREFIREHCTLTAEDIDTRMTI